jgi:hypothetical protein
VGVHGHPARVLEKSRLREVVVCDADFLDQPNPACLIDFGQILTEAERGRTHEKYDGEKAGDHCSDIPHDPLLFSCLLTPWMSFSAAFSNGPTLL